MLSGKVFCSQNAIEYFVLGQYGQIRYLAKAYIERPSNLIGKKSTIVTKTAFTVLSGLDLNFIPEAAVSTKCDDLCFLRGCFLSLLKGQRFNNNCMILYKCVHQTVLLKSIVKKVLKTSKILLIDLKELVCWLCQIF